MQSEKDKEANLGPGIVLGAIYGTALYLGFAFLGDYLATRYQWWGADSDIYVWMIAFFFGPVIGLLLGFLTVRQIEKRRKCANEIAGAEQHRAE